MIFTVGALVVGALLGLLTGGRLAHVAGHRLVASWLLVAGVILHVVAGRLDLGPLGLISLLAGYGCLLVFAALNRTLVGVGIVALGLAANAAVITVNGAMPVRTSAVVAAHIANGSGETTVDYGRLHRRERPGDRLRPLADIIPVPRIHEVMSFGDLILAVGVADLVVHMFHPKHRRRSHPTVPPLPPIPITAAAVD